MVMDYFKNHCWCSDSNWGGNYDCTIIVSLKSYQENYKDDWDTLMVEQSFKDSSDLFPEIEIDKTYSILKSEVLLWLEENIPDFKGNKGWCIGSQKYLYTDGGSFSIFFQRRRDAMKFIKTWSKWKKPLFYCQYFTDIRKQLDLTTGKYIDVS